LHFLHTRIARKGLTIHGMKKAPARQVARGRLKSMRVSGGFREFVLDQLAPLPGLRDRFGSTDVRGMPRRSRNMAARFRRTVRPATKLDGRCAARRRNWERFSRYYEVSEW
jgi:hypothetical protein